MGSGYWFGDTEFPETVGDVFEVAVETLGGWLGGRRFGGGGMGGVSIRSLTLGTNTQIF